MGREEHCKKISLACVGSTRSVWTTLGLPQLTAPVLAQSTLLRLQVALQGNCPKWALGCVHFPGLSCSGSGSRVLHKGTDSAGPAFCALPLVWGTQATGTWWAQYPRCTILSPPWSQPLDFLDVPQECRLRCAVCLFWGADLRLWPSWQMSTIQDPRKIWLALGACSQFGGGCRLRAWDCSSPSWALAVTCLPLCLWQGDGLVLRP